MLPQRRRSIRLNRPPGTSDLPEIENGFVVATGIECSAPRVGGARVHERRKIGPWERSDEDIELVGEFEMRHLRYGIPFHVVDHDPGSRDCAWTGVGSATSHCYRREDAAPASMRGVAA